MIVGESVFVGETGIWVSGALCDWHVAQVWQDEDEALVDRHSLGI